MDHLRRLLGVPVGVPYPKLGPHHDESADEPDGERERKRAPESLDPSDGERHEIKRRRPGDRRMDEHVYRERRTLPEAPPLRLREEERRIHRRRRREHHERPRKHRRGPRNAEKLEGNPQREDAAESGDYARALHQPALPLRAEENVVKPLGAVEIHDEKPTRRRHEDESEDRPSPQRRVGHGEPESGDEEWYGDGSRGYRLRPHVSGDLLAPHHTLVRLVIRATRLLRLPRRSAFVRLLPQ